jgi:hypothetical protein
MPYYLPAPVGYGRSIEIRQAGLWHEAGTWYRPVAALVVGLFPFSVAFFSAMLSIIYLVDATGVFVTFSFDAR